MLRIILIYGAILAAASFGLQWLQYRFLIRTHSVETYVSAALLRKSRFLPARRG